MDCGGPAGTAYVEVALSLSLSLPISLGGYLGESNGAQPIDGWDVMAASVRNWDWVAKNDMQGAVAEEDKQIVAWVGGWREVHACQLSRPIGIGKERLEHWCMFGKSMMLGSHAHGGLLLGDRQHWWFEPAVLGISDGSLES